MLLIRKLNQNINKMTKSNNLLKFICTVILLCAQGILFAQLPQLTLNECYQLAEKNYPLIKQQELIAKTKAYTIGNIQKGYLPQFNVSGQASYQSAVTQVPIKVPNQTIPQISKDQYKLYAEVTQLLYDGGAIKEQKKIQRTGTIVQQKQLETELYTIKERINQLFFGILLIDEQVKQNELLINNIQLGLNKVNVAIANGTSLKSNGQILQADILENNQHNTELLASRTAYINMLSVFIGQKLDDSTKLAKPQSITTSQQINRPELQLYEAQYINLDAQKGLLKSKTLPKFSLFFQGGAGRPGLDFLNNDLTGFYIGGLRLTWSPSAFYTQKKERAIIEINQQSVAVQKETFLFNTNLNITQENAEISKYEQLLSSDDAIIDLRTKIKATALVQLDNGVITSNDFLKEINAENEARQNKILHSIQLLISQYNQLITTGNSQQQ